MGKIRDLTNQRFGSLRVLSMDEHRGPSGQVKWICECDCGNVKSIIGSNLTSNSTLSCGCLHKSKISNTLVGQRFGKLVVTKKTDERTSKRYIVWECRCDCGNICRVDTHCLKQGNTMSCGCLKGSQGEMIIEKILIENKIRYIKEYTFEDLISPENKLLRFDFAILKEDGTLSHLIEYDGETHDFNYISGWNTEEKVTKQIKYDKIKNEYCKRKNIRLIRISYKDKNKIELGGLL